MAYNAHIVVVDDEPDIRELVQTYLSRHGLAVSAVESGAALRALIAQSPIDLAILDVNMPGENGIELARDLRAAGNVGIIMLTANSDPVDRVVGLEVGADDYVTKPFDPRELLARVRSVLRRAKPAGSKPDGRPRGGINSPRADGQAQWQEGFERKVEAADVFVSYARSDAAKAMAMAEGFRSCGYSVWLDEDIPPHRAFGDVIEEQLEAASSVVVLWSESATASQWVKSEANRARETGRLIQIRLDGSRLPMPFDQLQCADFSRARDFTDSPSWDTLVRSVKALVGSRKG